MIRHSSHARTAGGRALALFLCAGACGAMGPAHARAQHVYTGAQGNNQWCTPANWNPMSVPGGDAVIPGSITQRVSMADNCTPNFASLTAIGPVNFNGEVRYTGAVIAADIVIQSGNFTVGPAAIGAASLSLTDSAEWRNGILANQFVFVEGGGTLLITSGGHTLRNARLINDGAVTQSSALTVNGGVTDGITNDGTWTLAAPGTLLRLLTITDGAQFSNAGVLQTSFAQAGPAVVSLRIVNTGQVRAGVGDLDISESSHAGNGAQVSASPGRRLNLAGRTAFTGGSQASGDGTVASTSGLVTIDGGQLLTAVDVSGSFGGGFVLDNAQGLQLGIGASLRNVGTFSWRRADIVADSSIDASVLNEGRLELRASSGTLDRASIDNRGRLVVDVGTQVNLRNAMIASPAASTIEWRGGAIVRSGLSTPGVSTDIDLRGTLTKMTATPGRVGTPLRARVGSRVEVQEGELQFDGLNGSDSHLLAGGTFVVSSNALCRVLGEMTVQLGDITGQGVFRVANGGIVRIPPTGRLTASMEVSSDGLHISAGQVLGGGTLENQGTMVLSGATLGDPGLLTPMLIRNTGFLHARNSSQLVRATVENVSEMAVDTSITLAAGGSIVNSEDLSVGGGVTISAQAGVPAGVVVNTGSGTLRKREFDTSTISAAFSNIGTVLVQQGRLQLVGPILQLVGNAPDRALTGGTWIVQPEAALSFGDRQFRTIGGNAVVVADGTFDDFEPNRFRDQSITELGTLLDPNEDMIIQDQAEVRVKLDGTIGRGTGCSGATCPDMFLNDSAGLGGLGLVDRPCIVNDDARIMPGTSPGLLRLRALTMNGGNLDIEFAVPAPGTQHDVLAVTEHATLGGTLRLLLLDGYAPEPGSMFTVLTASSVTGAFARVVPPGTLDPTLRARLDITGTSVVVKISLAADFDGSGTVDPDDLADFIAAYFTFPPSTNADFDGSGTVDPDDLSDFIAAFFS